MAGDARTVFVERAWRRAPRGDARPPSATPDGAAFMADLLLAWGAPENEDLRRGVERLWVTPGEPDGDAAWIDHVRVRGGARGRGLGSRVLALLASLADRHGVELGLVSQSEVDDPRHGLSGDGLDSWYRRWGFEGDGVMRRPPSGWEDVPDPAPRH